MTEMTCTAVAHGVGIELLHALGALHQPFGDAQGLVLLAYRKSSDFVCYASSLPAGAPIEALTTYAREVAKEPLQRLEFVEKHLEYPEGILWAVSYGDFVACVGGSADDDWDWKAARLFVSWLECVRMPEQTKILYTQEDLERDPCLSHLHDAAYNGLVRVQGIPGFIAEGNMQVADGPLLPLKE